MSSKEEAAGAAEEENEADAAKKEYLLVEAAGRHAAVPLADVLRIEQTPVFAHRVHRLPARPQLRGPVASGRGCGRHPGRGAGASRGPDRGGRLPRRQPPCGHRRLARARRGRGQQPLRGRHRRADRRRHAAQEPRDGRGRSGRGGSAAGRRKLARGVDSKRRRQWHEYDGNRIASQAEGGGAGRGLFRAPGQHAVRRAHHAHS